MHTINVVRDDVAYLSLDTKIDNHFCFNMHNQHLIVGVKNTKFVQTSVVAGNIIDRESSFRHCLQLSLSIVCCC